MVPREFSVEGRTAIVTGAGGGMGRAIATVLAEAGADVAVLDIAFGPGRGDCPRGREAGTQGPAV